MKNPTLTNLIFTCVYSILATIAILFSNVPDYYSKAGESFISLYWSIPIVVGLLIAHMYYQNKQTLYKKLSLLKEVLLILLFFCCLCSWWFYHSGGIHQYIALWVVWVLQVLVYIIAVSVVEKIQKLQK